LQANKSRERHTWEEQNASELNTPWGLQQGAETALGSRAAAAAQRVRSTVEGRWKLGGRRRQRSREELVDGERHWEAWGQPRAGNGRFEAGWMARRRWVLDEGGQRAAGGGGHQGGTLLGLQACARVQRGCGLGDPESGSLA
jgi:hypothetical protein